MALIQFYQGTLGITFPKTCRFEPTCSEYALEAFRKFGFVKGLWFSFKRVLKCHPFHAGGYDPVI